MKTLANMGLVMWDQVEDPYDHSQLAADMAKIDNHDHTPGRGVRLTGESIAPGTITPELFASSVVTIPTGAVFPYGGDLAPTGFLLCDGAPVNREEYKALFKVIGTKFGEGNKTTTFNVPDLRSRVAVGPDGGAGRLGEKNKLGESDGEATVTLSTAQMAKHAHGISDPGHSHPISVSASDSGHSHSVSDPGHSHGPPPGANGFIAWSNVATGKTIGGGGTEAYYPGASTTRTETVGTGIGIVGNKANISASGSSSAVGTGISVTESGSNAPHNNMPPYLVLNAIIKV